MTLTNLSDEVGFTESMGYGHLYIETLIPGAEGQRGLSRFGLKNDRGIVGPTTPTTKEKQRPSNHPHLQNTTFTVTQLYFRRARLSSPVKSVQCMYQERDIVGGRALWAVVT